MNRQQVASGNLVTTRSVLLILFAVWRGCVFVLEDPSDSIIAEHPRMKLLCKAVKTVVTHTHVAINLYGAGSWKPLNLWSNNKAFIASLRKVLKKDRVANKF